MAKCKALEWQEPYKQALLEGWARDGLNLNEIAHNMGIARQTLYGYMKKYPNIFNTIKKGREASIYLVENAMFKSAIGYDVEEERKEIDGKHKKIIKTIRHIPGNVTAQIFIMKNKRPDVYRDKPVSEEIGYEDDGLIAALADSLSSDEIDEIISESETYLPTEEDGEKR